MFNKKSVISKAPLKEKVGIVTVVLLFLTVIMCIASIFLSCNNESCSYASAETSTTAISTIKEESTAEEASAEAFALPLQSFTAFQDINVTAPFAGLYSADTLTAIYEKEAQTKIHPASLAKILTAITALSYVPSDTVFTVGSEQELLPARSSLCLIKEGHQLTLYQLLSGMLIASGNDAAYTIAVNTARFVMNRDDISDKEALSYFSTLMNFIAETAGAENSCFINPDGFDNEKQYTTIRDLAAICRYALCFDEICEIAACSEKHIVFKSGENVTWKNSNQLLRNESPYYFPQATGMKTGTTPLAGKCLMAVAQIKDKPYICVVAGCSSEDSRYKSVTDLFDFASRI